MKTNHWFARILVSSGVFLRPVTGLVVLGFLNSFIQTKPGILATSNGEIVFRSEAPLENIQARSNKLIGLLNTSDRTFAFTVPIRSFKGFNNLLQEEHFNESYMESHKYTHASFMGTLIEKIAIDSDTVCTVRGRGILTIHGVGKERIIKATLTIKKGQVDAVANFIVPLSDHKIYIPNLVSRKISREIKVSIHLNLLTRQ